MAKKLSGGAAVGVGAGSSKGASVGFMKPTKLPTRKQIKKTVAAETPKQRHTLNQIERSYSRANKPGRKPQSPNMQGQRRLVNKAGGTKPSGARRAARAAVRSGITGYLTPGKVKRAAARMGPGKKKAR